MSFDQAIAVVLKHEGGFVNNLNDPGEATNFGISLRFLRVEGIVLDLDGDGDMDADDMRALTKDKAIALYKERFWDRYKYDRIPDQALATKVFDMCVVSGSNQAHRCLQRALRACGWVIKDDGDYGPKTQQCLVSTPSFPILTAFRSEAASFFRMLVTIKPNLREFENGWLRRAYS